MIEECVINGQHRAAWIAEHDLDPQVDQALNQYVRAALFGHDCFLPLVFAAPSAPDMEQWQGGCLY
jgi:hypothetical protein